MPTIKLYDGQFKDMEKTMMWFGYFVDVMLNAHHGKELLDWDC